MLVAPLTNYLLRGLLRTLFLHFMSALNSLPLPTSFISFLILNESITEPLPCVYSPVLSTGDPEVSLTHTIA